MKVIRNTTEEYGLIRISSASIKVDVGNTEANADEIIRIYKEIVDKDESQIIVMPECCVTSYTCGDLFSQEELLENAEKQIVRIASNVDSRLLIIGAPLRVGHTLYNCAVVINDFRVVGVIPKTHLPNYREFYESRWFKSGLNTSNKVHKFTHFEAPFGTKQLFKLKFTDAVVGVEICEDLFAPIPPSSYAAIGGANILCNVSASPEQVTKNEYRTDLVKQQSGRCVSAYVYSAAGPSESTTDLTFGGHCLIGENGNILSKSPYVGDGNKTRRDSYYITTEVDVKKLNHDRRTQTSFFNIDSTNDYLITDVSVSRTAINEKLHREIDGQPFVPKDVATLEKRCAEIYGIQCAALAKRIERLGSDTKFSIGVSGGLDSTHALLVLIETCKSLEIPLDKIIAVTMPGFGTTLRTKNNATKLMDLFGLEWKEIDIRQSCLQTFRDIQHYPFGISPHQSLEYFENELANLPAGSQDLQFENIQARRRTEILMALGFVVGTGDLSEIAQGYCTYNADHMSMYNPNCSIPKTLMKFLVSYVAQHRYANTEIETTLLDITNTVISAELLPQKDGQIIQSTEVVLGSYELIDFYLFNFVRQGFSPKKLIFLAKQAKFEREYSEDELISTLKNFYIRFFRNQFKRSCVPDGPKVGTVSLSPRGDWRMPSDASPHDWLKQIENI